MKVLIEFKADQNLQGRSRFSRGKSITAHECGLNHPCDRVRAIFSDRAGGSLHNTSEHKPRSLQVGRAWMVRSLSEMSETERSGPDVMDYNNTERLYNNYHGVRTSDGDQELPDNLDLSSFPVLDSTNQAHISSQSVHISSGPWSPSNISSIPTTERGTQVNPFPQLNHHIPPNPLETKAGKLWADFGKSKGHPIAEEVFPRSASNEGNSLPEKRYAKVRGKSRWQPLKF